MTGCPVRKQDIGHGSTPTQLHTACTVILYISNLTHTEEFLMTKNKNRYYFGSTTILKAEPHTWFARHEQHVVDACAIDSASSSLLPNVSALATSLSTATSLHANTSFQWLRYAMSALLPQFSSIGTLRRKAQETPSKQP